MTKLKTVASRRLRCNRQCFLLLLFSASFAMQVNAQQQNLPLNSFFSVPEQVIVHQSSQVVHSSFKPLLQSDLAQIDLSENYSVDTAFFLSTLKRKSADGSLLGRKAFHEHLFIVDQKDFYLTLDPLFDFSFGKENENSDELLYKNMRGFLLRANIGEKVSFQSTFRENQAKFGSYITEEILRTQDALGQGKVRELDDGGFDFAMASAYVSYSPSTKLNFQIGHGKHVVGDGIQSHFLSDRSFNYPFLKVSSKWFDGKLKYTNLYAALQEIKRLPYADREGLLYRKTGNFIYMDLALSSKFYIGIFEGRVWETIDTITGENRLPVSALIPVLGVNTILEKLDNKRSNGSVGINLKWKATHVIQLYSQAAMHSREDFSAQLGVKYFPAKNLFLQLEYNQRNTDSLKLATSEIAYSHYSRQLGFDKSKQLTLRAQYRYNRYLLNTELSGFSLQTEEISYIDLNVGYLINPATNFSFNFGFLQRSQLEGEMRSTIFYVSLRTNLQDIFYDI